MDDVWFFAVVLLCLHLATTALCFRAMAVASWQRRARAFVPAWNFLVLCDMAGVPRWLAFVPCADWVLFPLIAGRIAEQAGIAGWLGRVLGAIPLTLIASRPSPCCSSVILASCQRVISACYS